MIMIGNETDLHYKVVDLMRNIVNIVNPVDIYVYTTIRNIRIDID